MPKGSFVILLSKDADYKILGYYFKEKEMSQFKINSDLFLRLNLDHERNEFNLLRLKDLIILSYLYKIQGKQSRKASSLIFGLMLDESDDPERFKVSIKESAAVIEDIDLFDVSQDNFENKLRKIYQENIEKISDILDPESLKHSIINRTKEMLSGDKKERKIAQELLQKIESNLHVKISEFYSMAEDALKTQDYDKSEKMFVKASEIAEELLELELAKSLKERAKLSIKIPDLTRELNDIVQRARSALKKEDFHESYIFYKKAAEIAKELMQPDLEEEYSLKSKALQDFYQVDLKFKKKK
ncbi:MAG TPA: hypothetical protein VGB37_17590 [Candidatus Lokiarchaeia archaeon]